MLVENSDALLAGTSWIDIERRQSWHKVLGVAQQLTRYGALDNANMIYYNDVAWVEPVSPANPNRFVITNLSGTYAYLPRMEVFARMVIGLHPAIPDPRFVPVANMSVPTVLEASRLALSKTTNLCGPAPPESSFQPCVDDDGPRPMISTMTGITFDSADILSHGSSDPKPLDTTDAELDALIKAEDALYPPPDTSILKSYRVLFDLATCTAHDPKLARANPDTWPFLSTQLLELCWLITNGSGTADDFLSDEEQIKFDDAMYRQLRVSLKLRYHTQFQRLGAEIPRLSDDPDEPESVASSSNQANPAANPATPLEPPDTEEYRELVEAYKTELSDLGHLMDSVILEPWYNRRLRAYAYSSEQLTVTNRRIRRTTASGDDPTEVRVRELHTHPRSYITATVEVRPVEKSNITISTISAILFRQYRMPKNLKHLVRNNGVNRASIVAHILTRLSRVTRSSPIPDNLIAVLLYRINDYATWLILWLKDERDRELEPFDQRITTHDVPEGEPDIEDPTMKLRAIKRCLPEDPPPIPPREPSPVPPKTKRDDDDFRRQAQLLALGYANYTKLIASYDHLNDPKLLELQKTLADAQKELSDLTQQLKTALNDYKTSVEPYEYNDELTDSQNQTRQGELDAAEQARQSEVVNTIARLTETQDVLVAKIATANTAINQFLKNRNQP